MIYHFDLETQSEVDLKKVGLRNYASHPTTRVVCMAYQLDDGPVGLWTPNEGPPIIWLQAIELYGVKFAAHNIMFDMTIMELTLELDIPLKNRWIDTATLCATNNLPRALKHAVNALKLPEQKDAKGHRVMLQVSKPKKDGTFITDQEKLDIVYEYCKQDVRAEAQLTELPDILPEEKELEILTHEINERGFHVDMESVDAIQGLIDWKRQKYREELESMGLEVIDITSNKRFTELLRTYGVTVDNVQKATIQDIILHGNELYYLGNGLDRILQIRLDLAKTPLKKYDVLKLRTHEGRIKDGLVFCGATATGRFSGKGFQPQNLPRGSFPVTEAMFDTIKQGLEFTELIYGSIFEVAESALRGVLTATPGNRLLVVDYAQIEARVLAWLAGQDDVTQQFKGGKDVYSIMASKIYGKNAVLVTKPERTLGKVAVLGCGYGVGGAKFTDVCRNFGVETTEAQAKKTVDVYRKANAAIVKFWKSSEKAFKGALLHGTKTKATGVLNVEFMGKGDRVGIKLPSGRILKYQHVETAPDFSYQGVGINGAAWRKFIWGGVIVENITQAVARDIMAHAMLKLDRAGYKIVLTVHDELIVDATPDQTLQEMNDIMVDLPDWAKGCPITAEGFESFRYKKA